NPLWVVFPAPSMPDPPSTRFHSHANADANMDRWPLLDGAAASSKLAANPPAAAILETMATCAMASGGDGIEVIEQRQERGLLHRDALETLGQRRWRCPSPAERDPELGNTPTRLLLLLLLQHVRCDSDFLLLLLLWSSSHRLVLSRPWPRHSLASSVAALDRRSTLQLGLKPSTLSARPIAIPVARFSLLWDPLCFRAAFACFFAFRPFHSPTTESRSLLEAPQPAFSLISSSSRATPTFFQTYVRLLTLRGWSHNA
ncbi:hypothetical protein FALBO_15802, partial [Fusarium albosuccineum]